MTEMMDYSKSPIPPGKPGGIAGERNPDRGIDVDDRGQMNYASAASSGHIEVELPSLPGSPNPTERMLARDFGPHVVGKIEAAQNRPGYLTTGATQTPAQTFRHYIAVAKGAGLVDAGTISRMEKMAAEFEKEPNQQDYFELVVKPFLHGLTPTKRR